ncbi:MAG: hypothetical protein ONB13_03460, partial [candidate division KSB1 bacterium]|nr:hypothetical protein [candidate division KSB1 bacterium]
SYGDIVDIKNTYYLGVLEDGNYTFIVYVNGKQYHDSIQEFIVESKIGLNFLAYPYIEWNGKEWIAKIALYSNMVPKGIRWGNIEKTKDLILIFLLTFS